MGRSLFTARGLDALLVIATLAVVSLTVMQVAPWDRKVEAKADSLEGMLEINNQRVYQRVAKHLPLRTRSGSYGYNDCEEGFYKMNGVCELAPCGNGTSGAAPNCTECDMEGYNNDRDQEWDEDTGMWSGCFMSIVEEGEDSGAPDAVLLFLDILFSEFDIVDFIEKLYAALNAIEDLGITANNETVEVTATEVGADDEDNTDTNTTGNATAGRRAGADGTTQVTVVFIGDSPAQSATAASAFAAAANNNPSLVEGYEVAAIRGPRAPPTPPPAEEAKKEEKKDDDSGNGGVIAVIIIIIIIVCGGLAVIAFLMFRKSGDVADKAQVPKRATGGNRAGARGEAESEDEDEEESEDEESDDEETDDEEESSEDA